MQRIWVKLAVVLMAVSVSGILLSTLLSIKEMDYHFSLYLDEINRKHAQEIVALLKENNEKNGGWNQETSELLRGIGSVLDLNIRLYDQNRQWLAGQTAQTTATAGGENASPLIAIEKDGQIIGYVSIAPSSAAATEMLAEHFRWAHTSAMEWAMAILTLLVGVLSVWLARRIVKPVENMRKASLVAAGGDLTVRVPPLRGKDELAELVQSFNQLVAALETQEALRKRLTADIAHELRTPLNTLLAQVEGMIDGVWEASPEHLESTRSEILRLTRLVHDLDQVMQAAETMGLKERLDVSDVLRDVVQSMEASFQKAGIAVIRELQPHAWVQGDRQRLSQVFVNLLSNSLKHTPVHGQVRVTVSRDGQLVTACIADTGAGIAEHDLPFVFERFYRGDRSRQRGTGGSGLGLTIAKGIVDAHQGSIAIQSKLGEGTTVTVTFPYVENEDRTVV